MRLRAAVGVNPADADDEEEEEEEEPGARRGGGGGGGGGGEACGEVVWRPPPPGLPSPPAAAAILRRMVWLGGGGGAQVGEGRGGEGRVLLRLKMGGGGGGVSIGPRLRDRLLAAGVPLCIPTLVFFVLQSSTGYACVSRVWFEIIPFFKLTCPDGHGEGALKRTTRPVSSVPESRKLQQGQPF